MESGVSLERAFFGRRWIVVARLLFCGGLAAFGIVVGALFATGAMQPLDGRDGRPVGLLLLGIGVVMLLLTLAAGSQLAALRKPILRVSRDGIVVRMLARSALDGVRFVPGLIRVAWSLISLETFRVELILIPWSCFRSVEVRKNLLSKWLVLSFEAVDEAFGLPGVDGQGTGEIAIEETTFAEPVDECVLAILITEARKGAFGAEHWP